MLKIGITGNIGSGKTMVCRIFESMKIPVFYTDKEAFKAYNDPEIAQRVAKQFGSDVFDEKGNLIKQKLASIVFSNTLALEKINALIHPFVLNQYEEWLKHHNDKNYTLHEAAILFEHHLEKNMDFVINVSAPEEIRMKRVMKRDNITEEIVKLRMRNQWADDEKNKLADFVIYNDGQELLIPQIMKIHQILNQKNR